MSEAFVGEIRIFAGNFAPRNWAFCDGQLLSVSQNDALFSLFGTIYGGDGRTTFGLPDLRGRVPIHMGQGAGLSNRRIGAKSGAERVTLTTNQIPNHNHGGVLVATTGAGNTRDPNGKAFASTTDNAYTAAGGRGSTPAPMNTNAFSRVGGSQSHTNLAPTLCVHFIVALFGVYPSRN